MKRNCLRRSCTLIIFTIFQYGTWFWFLYYVPQHWDFAKRVAKGEHYNRASPLKYSPPSCKEKWPSITGFLQHLENREICKGSWNFKMIKNWWNFDNCEEIMMLLYCWWFMLLCGLKHVHCLISLHLFYHGFWDLIFLCTPHILKNDYKFVLFHAPKQVFPSKCDLLSYVHIVLQHNFYP